MTRTKNAAEFRKMLGRLRADYDRFATPRLDEVRNKYSDPRKGGPPESIAAAIEWHLRFFLINSFLAARNWRMNLKPEDGLPNLVPESPVRSEKRGSIRHLDYLGLETGTLNPLMIVETKGTTIAGPLQRPYIFEGARVTSGTAAMREIPDGRRPRACGKQAASRDAGEPEPKGSGGGEPARQR